VPLSAPNCWPMYFTNGRIAGDSWYCAYLQVRRAQFDSLPFGQYLGHGLGPVIQIQQEAFLVQRDGQVIHLHVLAHQLTTLLCSAHRLTMAS
jgi:hypothetical protein